MPRQKSWRSAVGRTTHRGWGASVTSAVSTPSGTSKRKRRRPSRRSGRELAHTVLLSRRVLGATASEVGTSASGDEAPLSMSTVSFMGQLMGCSVTGVHATPSIVIDT